MRLIDADELIIAFEPYHDCDWYTPWIIKKINETPTVNAVPVVRGEWIDTQPGYKNGYYRNAHKCSVCQDYYTTDYEYMNFCPNCGVRLVKDNE